MASEAGGLSGRVAAPPVDLSPGMRLLPTVLSLIAGSTDAIGFLGLGGLLTAHITGNLVILAAHIASGGAAQIAPMLSVPVFMAALLAAKLLAGGLQRRGVASLLPLLGLQFLLLAGFLVVGVATGAASDPDAPNAVAAGMLGVAAMAVQNGLVQISLKGAPSTAVMTTNVTRFMIDLGTVLLGGDPGERTQAHRRAARTLPAILGFAVGCAAGAACEAAFGLLALALPAGLALLAVVQATAARPAGR
jgi:uncharacterized membrane protein YoaK (UPF0700 family)